MNNFIFDDDHGKHSTWTRVKSGNQYDYVRTNNEGYPLDFDADTGYFTVYDEPDMNSHHYLSYVLPDNKQYTGTLLSHKK